MSIVCTFLGHKFRYADSGEKVIVMRFFGSTSNPIGRYEGLYVLKRCERCGYEHSDTFRIDDKDSPMT